MCFLSNAGKTCLKIAHSVTLALTALGITHIAWAEKPTLTVYTYDSFAAEWGPGPQIKKNFENNVIVNLSSFR